MPEGADRPATLTKRVWAFIIDLSIVGVLVAGAWAPLVLAVGDPLRFEPLFGFSETDCEVIEEAEFQNAGGRTTRVLEQACISTYFGLWRSYDRVRSEDTLQYNIHHSYFAAWPTDSAGRPIMVVTDGLVTAFALLIFFTLCEGSALRGTPGKFLFGLQVVNEDGERLNLPSAFGRNLTKLLPIIAMYAISFWNQPLAGLLAVPVSAATGIGLLMASVLLLGGGAVSLVTRRRQTFHDLISHALVRTAS